MRGRWRISALSVFAYIFKHVCYLFSLLLVWPYIVEELLISDLFYFASLFLKWELYRNEVPGSKIGAQSKRLAAKFTSHFAWQPTIKFKCLLQTICNKSRYYLEIDSSILLGDASPTMPYAIQPVNPTDSPGLARAMMSSFYHDKHWVLLWPNMSLEEIIDGCTKRLLWNLVKIRKNKRHQKVIDEATGEIVGYAWWVPPQGFEHIWLDAQVAESSAEDLAFD